MREFHAKINYNDTMNTLALILITIATIGLISLIAGLILFNKILNNIHQQLTLNNSHLADIARSQRILANNPKDFEETKRISQLKRD